MRRLPTVGATCSRVEVEHDSSAAALYESAEDETGPERSADVDVRALLRRRRLSSYHPGAVIAGKYELVRPLSQGGMGSVWVARNCDLDVDVAIKLIRPDLDASFVSERFVTEARLAARIEHPAIVSVFDLGFTERNEPYIVMELLRGEDLRGLLEERQRLPATFAVQLLLPVAEALATAHAQGVVHRDLKPENIFIAQLSARLQPKIVDFGIAKSDSSPRCITRAGALIGSPDYMSPEQTRGLGDVDQRADIWALSSVLYECLTGSPPFADSHYDSLMRDILEKPIKPITELGVPDPELWLILQRGLAKDREQRYASMRDLGRALAQWLRARWVDEDVCGHSLRATWLRESDNGRGSLSGVKPICRNISASTTHPFRATTDSARTSRQTRRLLPNRPARYVLWAGAAVVSLLIARSVWLGPEPVKTRALERLPTLSAVPLSEVHTATGPEPIIVPSGVQTQSKPPRPAAKRAAPRLVREVLVRPVRIEQPAPAPSVPRNANSAKRPQPKRSPSKPAQIARADAPVGS
jgi:eukaryotic-like serine/threonine-protein kinase